MLIRFLQACHESKQLYEQFFFSIYKPLHQLFDDEKAAPFAEALGRVLEKWSSLLEPGPINHRMLSAESSEAVHNMNLSNKPRDTQFNLVLRLVPDFAVKGYEALFLARQWRDILGSSGYSRELKFIHDKRLLASKRRSRQLLARETSDVTIPCSVFYNLEKKLTQSKDRKKLESIGHVTKTRATVVSRDYETDTNAKCDPPETNACARASDSGVRSKLRLPDSSHQRVDHLQTDLKREQIRVQRIRTELLQGEISSRYTTERPMLRPLLDTLAAAKVRCRRLRNEISKQGNQYDSCFIDRLDSSSSVQTGLTSLDSFASERIRSVTRPLLNSRHRSQTRDEQRLIFEDRLLRRGRSNVGLPKLCS